MGALFSRWWFSLFPAKEYKIVVVGLDNAGKTTTLYKLHLGEVVVTQPTIGSNVEEVIFKNIRFEVWDLGGQDSLRPSWATYYRGTHAVVMVVDSTDRARIALVKDELFRLLQHDELQQSVVLVFANKQDLKGRYLHLIFSASTFACKIIFKGQTHHWFSEHIHTRIAVMRQVTGTVEWGCSCTIRNGLLICWTGKRTGSVQGAGQLQMGVKQLPTPRDGRQLGGADRSGQ